MQNCPTSIKSRKSINKNQFRSEMWTYFKIAQSKLNFSNESVGALRGRILDQVVGRIRLFGQASNPATGSADGLDAVTSARFFPDFLSILRVRIRCRIRRRGWRRVSEGAQQVFLEGMSSGGQTTFHYCFCSSKVNLIFFSLKFCFSKRLIVVALCTSDVSVWRFYP